MVEWFKAAVLKTAVAQVTEGSNPSLSANNLQQFPVSVSGVFIPRFSPVFVTSFEEVLEKKETAGRSIRAPG